MLDWIKVADKVPEEDKAYICWTKDNGVGVGFYTTRFSEDYKGEKKWVIANNINEDVIAWAEFNYFEG